MRALAGVLIIGTSFVLLGCSLCPGDTKERGKKGHMQWCEAQDAQGTYVRSGPFRSWWPNGQLKQEGQFKEGRVTGHWVEYTERGSKHWELDYDGGVKVGVGKFFTDGRDIVADPDLSSPAASVVALVATLNHGDLAAVQRVLGPEFAKNAAAECNLRKALLKTGTESCDAEEIVRRVQRLGTYSRKHELSAVDTKGTKPGRAEAGVTSEGTQTEFITLYEKDGVWRPAQIPPEFLLPKAFEAMRANEVREASDAEATRGK